MSLTLRSPFRAAEERMQFVSQAVLLLFLGGWVAWFIPFDDLLDRRGTPLGADFAMFYVGAQVAAEGRFERLYDQAYHQARLQQLFPQLDAHFCLPFRYPPWVALGLAPLACLPYPAAFAVFCLGSLAAWLVTLRWLQRWLGGLPGPALGWALIGSPVVCETLIGGQASMAAALVVAGTLALLGRNRPAAAGAVLALAAYKPNVLVLFAAGLLVRYPRMLVGGLAVVAGLVGITWGCGAGEAIGEYVGLLGRLASGPWDVETPGWKVHSLASWVALFAPDHARLVTLGSGLGLTLAVAACWRRAEANKAHDALAVAALLAINTLFNPYTPIYDLVLLGPAAMLAVYGWRWKWPAASQAPHAAWLVQAAFAGLFFGPHLSQAVAQRLDVQLFPLVLAGSVALVAAYCWNRTSVCGTGGALSR